MTLDEIDELYKENIAQIANMDIAAGSMIKAVIQSLERNGPAYIRLSDASQYRVYYEHVEGDKDLLVQVCDLLGVSMSDITLETNH